MKKIISFIVVAVLFTTAAFAQDRRSYDNRYSGNSYSVNNGYSYSNPYNRRGSYNNYNRYNRFDRYRNTRVIYRHPRRYTRYYNDYRRRQGVSIHLSIGSRRRY
jgi:hypothetical protein